MWEIGKGIYDMCGLLEGWYCMEFLSFFEAVL